METGDDDDAPSEANGRCWVQLLGLESIYIRGVVVTRSSSHFFDIQN